MRSDGVTAFEVPQGSTPEQMVNKQIRRKMNLYSRYIKAPYADLSINSYLLLMNRRYKLKKMFNKEECPFCGGVPIKKQPYLTRIKRVGAGAGVLGTSAQGNIQVRSNPEKEEYYLCNGCNQEYVWADIGIDLILPHLDGNENIAALLRHYYPDRITLTTLMTCYVTGFVRKHNNKLSWLSNDIVKKQLYVCFNYEGVRTVGVLVRRKNTKYYYTIKTIGIPGI